MSTLEEREEMNKKVDDVIAIACNGNKQAGKYLSDIAWIARRIDDLHDKDVDVPKKEIERLFQIILIEIPTNPFFLQNFQALMSQHVVIYNAWLDSNKWENEKDETRKIYCHVIRDYIGELIPLVAFMTGGIERMRNLSIVSRETFMKEI